MPEKSWRLPSDGAPVTSATITLTCGCCCAGGCRRRPAARCAAAMRRRGVGQRAPSGTLTPAATWPGERASRSAACPSGWRRAARPAGRCATPAGRSPRHSPPVAPRVLLTAGSLRLRRAVDAVPFDLDLDARAELGVARAHGAGDLRSAPAPAGRRRRCRRIAARWPAPPPPGRPCRRHVGGRGDRAPRSCPAAVAGPAPSASSCSNGLGVGPHAASTSRTEQHRCSSLTTWRMSRSRRAGSRTSG